MSLLVEYFQEFRRFQRNARLYLISSTLNGMTIGIILILYNLYLAALGYGADFIGLVLFAGTIGAGIAIFPAGLYVDRFSGKTIILWSSLLIGIAGVGQILFRQPAPLLVSTFVAGVGGAFILVVNAPFLTTYSTPAERPLLFSLNITLSLVTTVLGEVLGGILPLWFHGLPWLMAPLPSWLAWALAASPLARSYQLALLLAGLISGPSLIPLLLMSNDQPVASSHTATQPLIPRLMIRQIFSTLKGLNTRTILLSPMAVMVAVQLLVGMGAGLFIPYFNIYFVQHLGASSALFGAIDGGANALNAVLVLVAPWLARRVGKVNTMTLTRLASVPLLLIIGSTNVLSLAAILYLFRQGFMDMSVGILQVFSMEVVPKQHRGLANSSYQAAFQVAWAITTPLGGLMIVHLGYTPIFLIGACLYLLAIVTLWGRFRHGQENDKVNDEEQKKSSG